MPWTFHRVKCSKYDERVFAIKQSVIVYTSAAPKKSGSDPTSSGPGLKRYSCWNQILRIILCRIGFKVRSPFSAIITEPSMWHWRRMERLHAREKYLCRNPRKLVRSWLCMTSRLNRAHRLGGAFYTFVKVYSPRNMWCCTEYLCCIAGHGPIPRRIILLVFCAFACCAAYPGDCPPNTMARYKMELRGTWEESDINAQLLPKGFPNAWSWSTGIGESRTKKSDFWTVVELSLKARKLSSAWTDFSPLLCSVLHGPISLYFCHAFHTKFACCLLSGSFKGSGKLRCSHSWKRWCGSHAAAFPLFLSRKVQINQITPVPAKYFSHRLSTSGLKTTNAADCLFSHTKISTNFMHSIRSAQPSLDAQRSASVWLKSQKYSYQSFFCKSPTDFHPSFFQLSVHTMLLHLYCGNRAKWIWKPQLSGKMKEP